jgi:hypothetical protein
VKLSRRSSAAHELRTRGLTRRASTTVLQNCHQLFARSWAQSQRLRGFGNSVPLKELPKTFGFTAIAGAVGSPRPCAAA